MTDPEPFSLAMLRVLQTTRSAWAQAPAVALAAAQPAPCKLSSLCIRRQRMAIGRPAPWGLPVVSHAVRHP